ncbi:MAG: hypothetical protein KBD00_01305 [Candidatus Peribacteraceae bacterium]|nr:hypothetical protein [Candidatus Peribacteraceae bacterium]
MTRIRRFVLRATLVTVALAVGITPALAYISPEEAFGLGSASSSTASTASSSGAASSSANTGTSTSSYSSYPPSVPHAAAGQQPPVTYIYSSPVSRRILEEQVASREAQQRKNNAYYYSPQFTDPNYQAPVITRSSSSIAPAQRFCSFYDDDCLYQQRRNAMADQPNVIVINGNSVYDSQGRVLHSGAPNITASGSADILFASVLFLAAAGTFYTVWREQKKFRRRSR